MTDYTTSCEVLEYCNHPEQMLQDHVEYNGKTGYCGIHVPAFVTVDLLRSVPIRELSFLLWDYLDPNNTDAEKAKKERMRYAYRVLTSEDRVVWNVIEDSLDDYRRGWQVFTFATPLTARYVRIHALNNLQNSGFHIVRLHVLDQIRSSREVAPSFCKEIHEPAFEREVGDQYPLSNQLMDLSERVHRVISGAKEPPAESVRAACLDLQDKLYQRSRELNAVDGKIDEIRRLIAVPVKSKFEGDFREAQKARKWELIFTAALFVLSIINFVVAVMSK